MGQRKHHMWTFLRQTDVENQKDPNQTRNKTESTQDGLFTCPQLMPPPLICRRQ